MPDAPAPLSAVSLRLAGHVGQATLDWVAARGVTAQANLDQHVAAVRATIAECESARGRRADAVTKRAAVDARVGAPARSNLGELLSTMAGSCPDVPFAPDARTAEPTLPLALLLHYSCGFLEEAVLARWWPATNRSGAADWESMRLAAVCKLISSAEAAAELHPDLYPQP
jgi:Family of unknown function (DUF6401)